MMPIKKLKTVCCLIFSMSLIGSALSAKPKTLIMNHQFPENAAGSKLDKWFADEVARETNGELKIKIFWSNALGDPTDNLTLLKNNAIDMAAMSAGYFPDQLPLFSAPNSIPMGMKNICQSSRIIRSLLKNIPEFKAEALSNGIRPLFFHLLNPYLLISKKPVLRLSDLKGLSVRTWGVDMPKLIHAAGGIPVTLFLPDIYDAFKNGIIEACPFSLDLALSYRIYDFASHITDVVLWEGPGWGIWISEKAWKRLSSGQQAVLSHVSQQAWKRDIPETLAVDREAGMQLKEKGVEFHAFPTEDLEKWQAANPDFMATMESNLRERGLGRAARQMIEIW